MVMSCRLAKAKKSLSFVLLFTLFSKGECKKYLMCRMLTPSRLAFKTGEKSSVFVIQLQSVLGEYVRFNFANIP